MLFKKKNYNLRGKQGPQSLPLFVKEYKPVEMLIVIPAT